MIFSDRQAVTLNMCCLIVVVVVVVVVVIFNLRPFYF